MGIVNKCHLHGIYISDGINKNVSKNKNKYKLSFLNIELKKNLTCL